MSATQRHTFASVRVAPGAGGDECPPRGDLESWVRWGDSVRYDRARGYVFRRDALYAEAIWEEVGGEPVLMSGLKERVRTPASFSLLGMLGAVLLAAGARTKKGAADRSLPLPAGSTGSNDASNASNASNDGQGWFDVAVWALFVAPLALCALSGFVF